MAFDDVIREEMDIASERAGEKRTFYNELMLKTQISRVPPRVPGGRLDVSASVSEAIQMMKERDEGCVLVTEDERIAGIFTDRDFFRRCSHRLDEVDQLKMRDVMTPKPETLRPSDPVVYALNKMSLGGFRHIALATDDGKPYGVLSIRQLVDYLVDFFGDAVYTIPPNPDNAVGGSRHAP